MANKIPTELILRIFQVFSKRIKDAILRWNQADTDSLLALLTCSYVTKGFSNPALITLQRTVLLNTKETTQLLADRLQTQDGPGYPLALLAVDQLEFQDVVTPQDLKLLINQFSVISKIKLAWGGPSMPSANFSTWMSCLPASGQPDYSNNGNCGEPD